MPLRDDRPAPPPLPSDRLTPTPGQQGRDERVGTVTLDELAIEMRDGFRHVLGANAETSRSVRVLESRMLDAFEGFQHRLGVLESHVFPSRPPPAPRAHMPSLSEVTQTHGGELAVLSGRVLAVDARVETLESINKQQSKAMGLAMPESSWRKKAFALVVSREGLKLALALATLLAAYSGSAHAVDAMRAADRALAPAAGGAP